MVLCTYMCVNYSASNKQTVSAFTTSFGLCEYTVLCFGLRNAPATFQSVINDVLRDWLGKSVLVYLHDIVIFSKGEVEHMYHLEKPGLNQCLSGR